MFKDTYQSGILSLFYSCGSKPLSLWSKTVKSGYVKRLTDEQIQSLVLEIIGSNVISTYISCPASEQMSLGIRLPYLNMLVKNLKKYFSFEVQILDDKDVTRRFRINNIQTFAKINPYICYLPLNLSPGWNHIQLNLAHYTKVSFNTCYVETIRIAVYANCRLRRIYFADRVYPDDELPSEYKLFVKKKKKSITSQENTS
ncbi:cilia- and flagella-associated protein 20-like isoform X1 [Rhodnius prolixus]|uniref:cilia- and flagella-associated protein 20-like isoform X1 n=1 Tax=Rhodnius prolixus TaxID=13249 RepID=UPI003D18F748